MKDRIKSLRKSLGMTYEQFAALVGVTWSTAYRWEMGYSRPKGLAVLRRLQEIEAGIAKGREGGK